MAQQDLTFSSTARPKDWVTLDRAYTFTFQAWSAGTQVVPSAATITIVDANGEDLTTPVTAAAVTIAGGGDMTYALTAGNADEIGANYIADVVYTVSGVDYSGQFVFDVVRVPLRNVVVHADLLLHHVDLASLFTGGETSTQNYIKRAFVEVCEFLDGRGVPANLTLNPNALRPAVEHLALRMFFDDKVREPGDQWTQASAIHAREYNSALLTLGSKIAQEYADAETASVAAAPGSLNTKMRIAI